LQAGGKTEPSSGRDMRWIAYRPPSGIAPGPRDRPVVSTAHIRKAVRVLIDMVCFLVIRAIGAPPANSLFVGGRVGLSISLFECSSCAARSS